MVAVSPPLHVMLDMAVAGTNIDALLRLDAAWTDAAKQGDVTDRDREALVALGRLLDAQFALVERDAAVLQSVCESYPEMGGRASQRPTLRR